MVEIARVIRRDTKILILDEPLQFLPPAEIIRLFEIVNMLKERGIAIIYIPIGLKKSSK
jgi:ABC-type sugar transport system ATPase subunit